MNDFEQPKAEATDRVATPDEVGLAMEELLKSDFKSREEQLEQRLVETKELYDIENAILTLAEKAVRLEHLLGQNPDAEFWGRAAGYVIESRDDKMSLERAQQDLAYFKDRIAELEKKFEN